MQTNKIAIYIFSYNRANYLDNCLKSISVLNMNESIFIIDDRSDDKKTCKILNKYSKKYEVIQPSKDGNDKNYGGLYSNMNYALDHASSNGFKYALFLQDDTQLVRQITKRDIDNFDKFFTKNLRAFEIHVFFEKKYHIDRKNFCTPDITGLAHFRTKEHKGHRAFTDIGLFNIKRTKEFLGSFKKDEFENEDFALKRNSLLGFYKYPIGHWLPFPMVLRGRKASKLLLISDKIAKADVYPIKMLDKKTVDKLFQQSKASTSPRYAEDWLETYSKLPYEYWSYGGFSNLINRKGLLRLVGIVLALLYAIFRKINIFND